ncbi:MAG: apolipoprotein acyltransferase [Actinomycetota bacterium]|nr:apolipoprotein acyltransferase [Actinomycetota bacterium]
MLLGLSSSVGENVRMRIHVLQLAYSDDEPVAERVGRVAGLVRAQEGADLVVLPELWAPGGFSYRTWAERAEEADGPTVAAITAAARDAGVVVHAGSIVERAREGTCGAALGETGRGLWNTSVLVSPDGGTLATYRKIHRFGFGQGEPTLLEAGAEVVTASLPGGVVVGLATCYDLRFPELFRALTDAGATLVTVPAAWPAERVEAWRLLGRARAIENQFIMIQCNTAGTHAGVTMGGHSQIVDATGAVVAEAGTAEEVLVADVDLAAVGRWRAAFPVLADRRLRPGSLRRHLIENSADPTTRF